MKKVLTVFLLLLCCELSFGQNKDVETLKQLNHDWINSFPTRDSATMNKIYADDMVLVSSGGSVFHKKDLLRNLMSPVPAYISAKVDSVNVRLSGNTGLVRATATSVFKDNGQEKTVTTCYLDVYEKRNGRWYAIASQVAMVSLK